MVRVIGEVGGAIGLLARPNGGGSSNRSSNSNGRSNRAVAIAMAKANNRRK